MCDIRMIIINSTTLLYRVEARKAAVCGFVGGYRSLDSKPGETVAATVPDNNVPVSIECDCRRRRHDGGNSGAIVKVVRFSATRLFYDPGVWRKMGWSKLSQFWSAPN